MFNNRKNALVESGAGQNGRPVIVPIDSKKPRDIEVVVQKINNDCTSIGKRYWFFGLMQFASIILALLITFSLGMSYSQYSGRDFINIDNWFKIERSDKEFKKEIEVERIKERRTEIKPLMEWFVAQSEINDPYPDLSWWEVEDFSIASTWAFAFSQENNIWKPFKVSVEEWPTENGRVEKMKVVPLPFRWKALVSSEEIALWTEDIDIEILGGKLCLKVTIDKNNNVTETYTLEKMRLYKNAFDSKFVWPEWERFSTLKVIRYKLSDYKDSQKLI